MSTIKSKTTTKVLRKKKKNGKVTSTPNPRNTVGGIVISKHPSIEEIGDLTFLAYEYDDQVTPLAKSKQFEILEKLGFSVPGYQIFKKSQISIPFLTELVKFRKKSVDCVYV